MRIGYSGRSGRTAAQDAAADIAILDTAGHVSIVPGPRNKEPASKVRTMRVARQRAWPPPRGVRTARLLVHIMRHYATLRGETPLFGRAFASP